MMYREKIINLETGQETFRDFTQDEIDEAKKGELEAINHAKKMAEVQTKRESALAKLMALGLTSEEIAAL